MQKMNASCSTQHGRGRAQRRHPSARRTGTVTQGLAQARHHWHCTLYEMSSAALMGPANRAENTVLARRKSRAGSQSGRAAAPTRATRNARVQRVVAFWLSGRRTTLPGTPRSRALQGAPPTPRQAPCLVLARRVLSCLSFPAEDGSHEVKVDM